MLEHIIEEYRFFNLRRTVYTRRHETMLAKLIADHPPIPRYEWTDGNVKFSARLTVTETTERVVFEFAFTRNGKPCTFQPILNSYRRLRAKAELTNTCLVC